MRPRDSIHAAVKRHIVLNELRPGMVLTGLSLAADLDCTLVTPFNPELGEHIDMIVEIRSARAAS